jgi:hypothetical protein
MLDILVTRPTFQSDISQLKPDALRNMLPMFVAALTFQLDMSELKLDFD